jgi:fructose-1,6-bisphosphatase
MKTLAPRSQFNISQRLGSFFIVVTFLTNTIFPSIAQAQSLATVMVGGVSLPQPGVMVNPSVTFQPAVLAGLTLNTQNPFEFNFIINTGEDHLQGVPLEQESKKLINYFLASLTVPEDEMWVNLSPYEKDRIIADGLSQTEMGRDMLAQDYLLKQLTASMMYPESEYGKAFWQRIKQMSGGADIPTDTFNKVWIMPDVANVYVHDKNVFVAKTHLKVLLEEDYLALEKNKGIANHGLGIKGEQELKPLSKESAQIVRDVVLPEIEKEVNEGKNFANLRQIYSSMVLAAWYKKNLKQSLLNETYSNQNKVNGIDLADKDAKEQLYAQYLEAFKKGVYDYIKEEYDPSTQQVTSRKYFSGGLTHVDPAIVGEVSATEELLQEAERYNFAGVRTNLKNIGGDGAMLGYNALRSARIFAVEGRILADILEESTDVAKWAQILQERTGVTNILDGLKRLGWTEESSARGRPTVTYRLTFDDGLRGAQWYQKKIEALQTFLNGKGKGLSQVEIEETLYAATPKNDFLRNFASMVNPSRPRVDALNESQIEERLRGEALFLPILDQIDTAMLAVTDKEIDLIYKRLTPELKALVDAVQKIFFDSRPEAMGFIEDAGAIRLKLINADPSGVFKNKSQQLILSELAEALSLEPSQVLSQLVDVYQAMHNYVSLRESAARMKELRLSAPLSEEKLKGIMSKPVRVHVVLTRFNPTADVYKEENESWVLSKGLESLKTFLGEPTITPSYGVEIKNSENVGIWFDIQASSVNPSQTVENSKTDIRRKLILAIFKNIKRELFRSFPGFNITMSTKQIAATTKGVVNTRFELDISPREDDAAMLAALRQNVVDEDIVGVIENVLEYAKRSNAGLATKISRDGFEFTQKNLVQAYLVTHLKQLFRSKANRKFVDHIYIDGEETKISAGGKYIVRATSLDSNFNLLTGTANGTSFEVYERLGDGPNVRIVNSVRIMWGTRLRVTVSDGKKTLEYQFDELGQLVELKMTLMKESGSFYSLGGFTGERPVGMQAFMRDIMPNISGAKNRNAESPTADAYQILSENGLLSSWMNWGEAVGWAQVFEAAGGKAVVMTPNGIESVLNMVVTEDMLKSTDLVYMYAGSKKQVDMISKFLQERPEEFKENAATRKYQPDLSLEKTIYEEAFGDYLRDSLNLPPEADVQGEEAERLMSDAKGLAAAIIEAYLNPTVLPQTKNEYADQEQAQIIENLRKDLPDTVYKVPADREKLVSMRDFMRNYRSKNGVVEKTKNASGDAQHPLDKAFNAILNYTIRPLVSAIISEEDQKIVYGVGEQDVNTYRLVVFTDPIDGSSQIDKAGAFGSIITIGFLKPGETLENGDFDPRTRILFGFDMGYATGTSIGMFNRLNNEGKPEVVQFGLTKEDGKLVFKKEATFDGMLDQELQHLQWQGLMPLVNKSNPKETALHLALGGSFADSAPEYTSFMETLIEIFGMVPQYTGALQIDEKRLTTVSKAIISAGRGYFYPTQSTIEQNADTKAVKIKRKPKLRLFFEGYFYAMQRWLQGGEVLNGDKVEPLLNTRAKGIEPSGEPASIMSGSSWITKMYMAWNEYYRHEVGEPVAAVVPKDIAADILKKGFVYDEINDNWAEENKKRDVKDLVILYFYRFEDKKFRARTNNYVKSEFQKFLAIYTQKTEQLISDIVQYSAELEAETGIPAKMPIDVRRALLMYDSTDKDANYFPRILEMTGKDAYTKLFVQADAAMVADADIKQALEQARAELVVAQYGFEHVKEITKNPDRIRAAENVLAQARLKVARLERRRDELPIVPKPKIAAETDKGPTTKEKITGDPVEAIRKKAEELRRVVSEALTSYPVYESQIDALSQDVLDPVRRALANPGNKKSVENAISAIDAVMTKITEIAKEEKKRQAVMTTAKIKKASKTEDPAMVGTPYLMSEQQIKDADFFLTRFKRWLQQKLNLNYLEREEEFLHAELRNNDSTDGSIWSIYGYTFLKNMKSAEAKKKIKTEALYGQEGEIYWIGPKAYLIKIVNGRYLSIMDENGEFKVSQYLDESKAKQLIYDAAPVVGGKPTPYTGRKILPAPSGKNTGRNRNMPLDKDPALTAENGGIDFNADNLNLEQSGEEINFEFDENNNVGTPINGLQPVIINISPLPSIYPLLGMEPHLSEEPALSANL